MLTLKWEQELVMRAPDTMQSAATARNKSTQKSIRIKREKNKNKNKQAWPNTARSWRPAATWNWNWVSSFTWWQLDCDWAEYFGLPHLFCLCFCFCHISATSSSAVGPFFSCVSTLSRWTRELISFWILAKPTTTTEENKTQSGGERKSENGTRKMPINSTIGKPSMAINVFVNLVIGNPSHVRWHWRRLDPMCGVWFTPLNSFVFLQHSQNQTMESGQIYPIKNKIKKEVAKSYSWKTNDIWAIGIIIRTKKISIWLLSTKVHVSISRW